MGKDDLTYKDLIASYGLDSAIHVLKSIERLAEIENDIQNMDCEARLKTALDALNEINFATRH